MVKVCRSALWREKVRKQDMFVVAIAAGIVVGVAAFAPLVFGMNLARNATPTSNFGHAGALLLGVLGSFVILAVAVVLCIVFFRDLVLPFVLAEVAALTVAAIVFGVSRMIRR